MKQTYSTIKNLSHKENNSHSARVKQKRLEAATDTTSNHNPLQPRIVTKQANTKGLWSKERIETKLLEFYKEHGRLPSRRELYKNGCSHMYTVMLRDFGGLYKFAQSLGLEYYTIRGHWNDWNNVKRAILGMYRELGHFPSYNEMRLKYHEGLTDALPLHGGREVIASKLGIPHAALNVRTKPRVLGEIPESIIEPSNPKSLYLNWKARAELNGISEVSKINSKTILEYLTNGELGMNMAGRKKLSYGRLYALSNNLTRMCIMIQDNLHQEDITKLTRKQAHDFFFRIGNGTITRKDGKPYGGVGNLQKDFISFFNWYVRKQKLEGVSIENICDEIRQEKGNPGFVYFTFEDLKKALLHFTKDEQVLLLFAFDSIVRSPKELSNIRVRDIEIKPNGEVWVSVNGASSKTFGRTFNLLLCGEDIKAYLARKNLSLNFPLFPEYSLNHAFRHRTFPQKIQEVFVKVFGDIVTKGGKKLSEITLYSFRHNGATHLESLGIDSAKIMYRAGWSNYDRLKYYTHHLGHNGKISLEEKQSPEIQKLLTIIEDQNKRIAQLTDLLTKKLIAV